MFGRNAVLSKGVLFSQSVWNGVNFLAHGKRISMIFFWDRKFILPMLSYKESDQSPTDRRTFGDRLEFSRRSVGDRSAIGRGLVGD